MRHAVAALATIFTCSLSPAAAQTCDEIAGWWSLVTLADACKRAGFPLEREEQIRKGFGALSSVSSNTASPVWQRARAEGRQHDLRLFNAGVLADSPAFACAKGDEIANDWLPNAVKIACQ